MHSIRKGLRGKGEVASPMRISSALYIVRVTEGFSWQLVRVQFALRVEFI